MTLIEAPATTAHACVATTMRGPAAAIDTATDLADAAFLMGMLPAPRLLVGTVGDPALNWRVLSDLDLLRAAVGTLRDRSAGALAAADAVLVDIEDDLLDVADKLISRGSAHGIVTDAGLPVGVISALDIIGALAR